MKEISQRHEIVKGGHSRRKEPPFSSFYKRPEYLHPLKHPVLDFPLIVNVEISNRCNLKCLMCAREYRLAPSNFMDWDVFTKVIDEISEYGAGVRFSGWGEPFLHPDIFECIKYVKGKGLLLHVITNGQFLEPNHIDKLMECPPDEIKFSMQGLNRDSYETIRQGASWGKLCETIRSIHETKAKLKIDFPHVIISTTTLHETLEERKNFITEWENMVDEITFGYTNMSLNSDFYIPNDRRDIIEVLRKTEQFTKHYTPCVDIYIKAYISANGFMHYCCGDFIGNWKLGDIKTSTIKELWSSMEMNRLREIHKDPQAHKIFPLCKDCITLTNKFDQYK